MNPRALVVGWLYAASMGAAACAWAADGSAVDELADVLAQPVYGSSRIAGASKREQDLSDTPGMVYVRTGGEIRAQGYRTLAEVLDSLPGLHSSYDRSYTYSGVRGISRPGDYSSRLLLLVDGVRVNEAIYDSATGGGEFPLDVGLIDRLEYIPGPGSALYGSNAVLGVVNIITRSASQLAGPQATLEAGSLDARKLVLSWGGDWGPVRAVVALSSVRNGGHDQLQFPTFEVDGANGIAHHQDAERRDQLFAKLRWDDFTLSARLSDRTKADPTGSYGAIFDTRSESTDRYALLNLAFARSYAPQRDVYAHIGVSNYAYRGRALYEGVGDEPVPSLSRADARWLQGELRHVWSDWRNHRVMLGVEFQDNRRQDLRTEDLAPEPYLSSDLHLHSSRWSVFVDDDWSLNRQLRIHLGLRSDRRLDGGRTTSPRLALDWAALPGLQLKLQSGRAFREPNASELVDLADLNDRRPPLRVESTRTTEASALWQVSNDLGVSATLYSMHMQDSITLVRGDDGIGTYTNTGATRSRGAEFEATRRFDGGAQLRSSWSVQHATDDTTGEAPSDSPRRLIKLMFTTPGPWPGTRLGSNLLHVGSRSSLAGERLPSHTLLNAQFSVAPAARGWGWSLAVYNLTGQRYADPVGPDFVQDTLTQDGRNWRLQLSWAP